MATLRIWETVRGDRDRPLIRLDERVVSQSLTFTTLSVPSAAFAATTGIITVRADTACVIRVAAGPTAPTAVLATDYPLDANVLYDFEVRPGDRLAVIS